VGAPGAELLWPAIQPHTGECKLLAGSLFRPRSRNLVLWRLGVCMQSCVHCSQKWALIVCGFAGSSKRSDAPASRGSRDSLDAPGSRSFDSADGSLSDSLDAADAGELASCRFPAANLPYLRCQDADNV